MTTTTMTATVKRLVLAAHDLKRALHLRLFELRGAATTSQPIIHRKLIKFATRSLALVCFCFKFLRPPPFLQLGRVIGRVSCLMIWSLIVVGVLVALVLESIKCQTLASKNNTQKLVSRRRIFNGAPSCLRIAEARCSRESRNKPTRGPLQAQVNSTRTARAKRCVSI